MLDKMGGIFAPRPSTGPHKLRESFPLVLILRNRLKYALTGREALRICMARNVKVDGKVRTDPRYPSGFMDVITLEKTNENFRILYDVKGRFSLVPIDKAEAKFKICKVVRVIMGQNKVPLCITSDGRTVRYPDPLIKVNDSVKIDLATGKVTELIKFDVGQLVMIISGHNQGRVGVLQARERHPGSFDIIYVKDAAGNSFATRLSAAYVIGNQNRPEITLPKGKGIAVSIIEEKAQKEKRLAAQRK